jgi:hypothetical protein
MRKKIGLLLSAAMLGTLFYLPYVPTVSAAVPSGTVWSQDLSKSDEFDSLDTNKWDTSFWYSTSGVFAFNQDNASVSGGNVNIAAKKENYNGKSYTAGLMKSKFQVGGDSYTEIRAKMINKNANVTAALWLSDEPAQWSNPNIEIDIQETLDADGAPKDR